MARTFNRQPFSVSTSGNDYSRPYFFNQTQFKGLCDNQNDVSIDPLTFSDVQNMYVDENGILTSRPPFKIYDGESYIVEQWTFGQYGLRLHRLLCYLTQDDEGKDTLVKVENTHDHLIDELYFVFVMRCITHDTVSGTRDTGAMYSEYEWVLPVSVLGWDYIPKVTCAQIEDKVFIWFAGLDFIAFNTAGVQSSDGTIYPYFEDAVKYLYYPIHKLVINGIESELETKNYLTETYRRRYQYSTLSSVNFEKLAGRQMSVNMNGAMTQDKSKHLYDIIVQEHQDKMMLYPYSPVGSNYHIDIAQTPRSTVVMRYSITSHIIEVSFDGKYFRPLPTVEDIVGLPQLTRDGLWVVAFTTKGLAKCRLVAQESIDFVDDENVFAWVVDPYMRNVLSNGFPSSLDSLDSSFTPTGYFETIDQFAYIFCGPSIFSNIQGNIPYLYAEWLNGVNDVVWGYEALVVSNDTGTIVSSILQSDDIKVHFRYVAPAADHKDLGAVISMMVPEVIGFAEGSNAPSVVAPSGVLIYFFNHLEDNINRTLRSGDILYIQEDLGAGWNNYCYRLDSSGKSLIENDDTIYSGDVVLGTPLPMDISNTPDYGSTKSYVVGEYCIYDNYIYRCRRDCTGILPTFQASNAYWDPVMSPVDPRYFAKRYHRMEFTMSDGKRYYADVTWEFVQLCLFNSVRYRIERTDNATGTISPGQRVKLTELDLDILYTPYDLIERFGPLNVYNSSDGTLNINIGWTQLFLNGLAPGANTNPKAYNGKAIIIGVGNPAELSRLKYIGTDVDIVVTDDDGVAQTYTSLGYGGPCSHMDTHALAPTIEANRMLYEFILGYNILTKNENDESDVRRFDCLCRYKYEFVTDKFVIEKEHPIRLADGYSTWFKIMPNTANILTDVYFYCDGDIVLRPQNGELAPGIDDTARNITNNDNLVLALRMQEGGDIVYYNGNIHRLTPDGTELASGLIKSGDVVSYVPNAETEQDYLTPSAIEYIDGVPISKCGNRFYIERLAINSDGNFVTATGEIKQHELIRLVAYDKEIRLPVGNPGNPFNEELVIEPWVYPEPPADWEIGDDWPDTFPTYPPIYANIDGTIRPWVPGDALPSGRIALYGATNLFKRIIPLSIDSNGAWYNVDGVLWTSQMSTDAALELDEYVNTEIKDIFDENGKLVGRTRVVDLNTNVPEAYAVMNEYYFSYVDEGKNLLQVSATRRDEDKLFSEEGMDLLLYLPKRNEQRFANYITALHPLSNTEMGVFTDNDIWYITTFTDGGSVGYTKPIKSKIPVGLRRGSDVITALDGQVLIFPTPRGLVGLAPQDFVATTEKTMTYLTDAIQDTYHKFYNSLVMSTSLIPTEFELGYKPFIHLCTYKYWIIMYKYLDREMLALDTRTGTWWRWTTPYPIRSVVVGSRLHVLLQMDFSPIDDYMVTFPVKQPSLLGVSFIWSDRESAKFGYCDDTVSGVLDGTSEYIYVNDRVGYRRKVNYASPIIDWYFVSQRLHFDQINNYKAIKGINLNIKGDETMTAKMSTKVFRNLYHPEQSDVVQIKVNDVRTFVKRFNLMHVIDFQYKIENDADTDAMHQRQFKLNSLSVKYEVKERVR